MKNITLSTLAMVALLASCQKSEVANTETAGAAISFSSGILTRASGDMWEENDQLGIFMYTTGASSVYDGDSSNALYYIESGAETTSAKFISDTPLYHPIGKGVDFFAYYPYVDSHTGSGYSYDVSDQSTDEKYKQCDIMAACIFNYSYIDDATPELEFTHLMSKFVFNIVREDNMESAEISAAQFSGCSVSTSLVYDSGSSIASLSSSSVSGSISANVTDNVVELLVSPQTLSGVELKLTIDGVVDAGVVSVIGSSAEKTILQGYQYSYNVYLGEDKVTISEATISPWGPGSVEDSVLESDKSDS